MPGVPLRPEGEGCAAREGKQQATECNGSSTRSTQASTAVRNGGLRVACRGCLPNDGDAGAFMKSLLLA